MGCQQAQPSGVIRCAAKRSLGGSAGGKIHERSVEADSRRYGEVPGLLLTAGIDANYLTERNGNGFCAFLREQRLGRIARQPQILREHVPGAEWNQAKRNVRSGEALKNSEEGAVSTTGEYRVEAAVDRFSRLPGRARAGQRVLHIRDDAFSAEDSRAMREERAPVSASSMERVDEK